MTADGTTSLINSPRSRPLALALLLAIVAAGALFIWWSVVRADRAMRSETLQQARLAARAVNLQHVQALSGTAADIGTSAYWRLKEQLASNRSANSKCRFMGLMGRKPDRTVFFFVDSETPYSKDYSPPGQVYEEAPEDCQRVFDAKTEAAVVLATDRWGVWISPLVPITDPQTGTVIAVLGMAIDARDWKWAVAARAALPVGLILMLLIGAATVYANVGRGIAAPKPVLRRLLLPLTAILTLLLAGAGALLYHQYQHLMTENIADQMATISRELRVDLENQSAGLAAAVQPIVADPRLPQALRAGDADSLLATWRGLYESLHRENHVTHLYFLDKNRVCLLRVHEPARRGDRIERFTARTAERTGKPASGIEIGSRGTLTLRVVQPVFAGGTIVGYVEMGRELEDVLQARRDRAGLELAATIDKQHLDRKSWEQVMRLLGRDADWDRLTQSVVIYASQGRLPDAFSSWADQPKGTYSLGEMDREIVYQGKTWRVFASPLLDASGQEIGKLLVMRDMTADQDEFASLLVLGGTSGGVLLTLLLAFMFVLLRQVDVGILAQQKELRESEERFRSAFQYSAIGMALVSLDGRWLKVNFKLCSMLGYGEAELLAKTFQDITHPDDLEVDLSFVRQLLAGEIETYEMEKRYFHKDGRVVWVLLSVSLARGNAANPLYFISQIEDITVRKRAEDALRSKTALLEAQTNATIDGILIVDENQKRILTNRRTIELFNVPQHILDDEDDTAQLKYVVGLTRDPEQFLAKVLYLYDHVNETSRDEIELKNGLVLDRYSAPVLGQDGKYYGRIWTFRDITARKAMEVELRDAARTDKLTGLPNRALLCDRLQQAILRSHRLKDYHFAVLFFDFDRFKTINDSFGHDVGDLLLQEIGRRLQATVRCGDSLSREAREHTTARFGGDEFVVLLDGIASPQDAITVANRLLEAFAHPYQLGTRKVYSTASIGIVTSDMTAENAIDVLRDADTAMYEAKLAGKAQYAVFDMPMRQRVQNRLHLENDLRKALDANQLFLMYQPIVSLETGKVESFEALVRWKHPERGLISPGEFIPIAEDTGLIVPIGEWILGEACRQFTRWRASLGDAAPPSISVNLSRKQLSLPSLPQTIRRIVEQSGITPDSLHLEITESAVMKDPAAATSMLHAVKAIGVKLDMDDFGTGYSSLSCLHDFPLDVLKIDRAFIANIDRGRDFVALVEAVVHLARNLNIHVVGEGIETADQLLTLQSLGCEFGQGYLFSKPLLAEQVPEFTLRPVVLPGVAMQV